MRIYFQAISCNAQPLLLLVFFVNIYITKATTSTFSFNDYTDNYARQAEEYIMTSKLIDGIKRSNVCGDGYRIEGAVLKSYPYSKRDTYLPYENCLMTFQARRSNNHIRIHIVTLDLNDIHSGTDCLDSIRFYKSFHVARQEKLDSIECGQINEAEKFNMVSPTGVVTVHFSTDGGNVNGLGFKIILTAFRPPNKTHPCDQYDDEFLCSNGDCISNALLCDGVAHCLDGSDEIPNESCVSNADGSKLNPNINTKRRALIAKHHHWRGILIIAFLLIIFIVFVLFLVYFICRHCVDPSIPLANENTNHRRKNYKTIVHTPLNGSKQSPSTQVIKQNDKNRKHLDDDYNLI
ncbi:unnamed protein product [Rotaria magnacalcarata]|uniref:CUB domain-containing protein n=1 Tax=Rotaria magnacalcarata TaxID=392030 RepID=A0A819BTB2_9BILA|nr:unnamed protein product [Rotaria magnacalcarata]CAF1637837.1 unnamed protein product [Rotaria magnacalcarata]CAF1907626.1 unnamed protein product [Rotaria magnacalcarata]CAF2027081.1 unnamed protein product [Rotaria magnacalcarata]CAF2100551.1 unnamed protein product [Rotaria magnacalcarata]